MFQLMPSQNPRGTAIPCKMTKPKTSFGTQSNDTLLCSIELPQHLKHCPNHQHREQTTDYDGYVDLLD